MAQTFDDRASMTGIAGRLPILRYWSIPATSPQTAPVGTISVRRLRDHLGALQRHGWSLVGLTEALSGAHDRRERSIALTFDDGLLDFLNAVEVLESVGARATLYVPVELVGLRVGRWDRGYSRLDWPHLEELSARGIEIGVQCGEDGRLRTLDNAAMDRNCVEERLHNNVATFCFTNRRRTLRAPHRRMLARAGYKSACTVRRGVADMAGDRLSLSRVQVTAAMSEDHLIEIVSQRRSYNLLTAIHTRCTAYASNGRSAFGAGCVCTYGHGTHNQSVSEQ